MFLIARSAAWIALTGLLSLLLSAPAFAGPPVMPPPFAPDQVVVVFQPGTAAADKRAAHSQAGSRVIRTIPTLNAALVSVPANSVQATIDRYGKNPNVRYAEPNFYRTFVIPDEGQEPPPPDGVGDYFKEQWGLHNSGQGFGAMLDPITLQLIAPLYNGLADADIDAPEGWDGFLASCPDAASCPPSRIAILDSGVECAHVDLNCDYDVNLVAGIGAPNGDLIGHGTHVAGIAAARFNNDIGVSGVAINSPVGSFKVCYGYPISFPTVGVCESVAIAEAVNLATQLGYDVINMSFGGPTISQAEQDAISQASSQGVVMIGAGGNDYRNGCDYPGMLSEVIAVGASDHFDNLSSFSNFGNCISLLAPGSESFATYPSAGCGIAPDDPLGCYTWQSGTSMAVPLVSGAAALLKTLLGGSADNQQIRTLLENNADSVGTLGQNMLAWSQFGRLNLANAVNGAGGQPPPSNDALYVWDIQFSLKGKTLNTSVYIKWDSDGDGIAEASDAPASGATLSVSMCSIFGCNFEGSQGTTDGNGKAVYKLRNPQPTSYTFTVQDIQLAPYSYSPAMDQNNPASYQP
ncbi:S8 family peptidase [Marinobacterium arenosum]|uniref:S8 family peptidase n=1 Tax=Marinobacterium arenosum TaxID=2862496 RepID=UPI001C94AD3C|nr:S8 family serine peptidase [Marinobacterium arenosum]MBY4676953.1 S8 family serine peptidase [Marinobacterium arenosum]